MNREGINMRKTGLAAAITLALAAGNAHAISFSQNGWNLDINGTVNAFMVSGSEEITGAGTTDQTNIQNGLLPGWINFVATTQQKGYDIKAHISFAPGITDNSNIVGLPSGTATELADAYPKVDTRQVYFQFGKPTMGSFKFGRDIGLFMQNEVLSDMTLMGVGGTVRAAETFNTSFGMIGHGYMYVGFQPQITYTTPDMSGFSASVGMFNPEAVLTDSNGNVIAEKRSPGVQALASYAWKGSTPGKVWMAGLAQSVSGENGNDDINTRGVEGGVKMGFGDAEVVLSAFSGKALGISTVGALFLGTNDATGDELSSSGYFTQFTYKVMPDLKLGINYGENKDKDLVANGVDTKRKAYTLGAYYNLTESITLVAEYTNERTDNVVGFDAGTDVKAHSIALGGMIFF